MITETQQTFVLDHRVKCSRAQRFGEELSARIVGQEKAVDATLLAAAARKQWMPLERVGQTHVWGT